MGFLSKALLIVCVCGLVLSSGCRRGNTAQHATVATYVRTDDQVSERIELKADGQYLQTVGIKAQVPPGMQASIGQYDLTNRGTWRLLNVPPSWTFPAPVPEDAQVVLTSCLVPGPAGETSPTYVKMDRTILASAFVPQTLAAPERQRLLQEPFQTDTRVAAIPSSVKEQFVNYGQSPFSMAEPGQRFQWSDVITHPRLPWRRLIFVGVSKDACIVAYEHGGYAPSRKVALFRLVNGQARLVWVAALENNFSNLEDVREDVQQGKFFDMSPWL